MKLLSKLKLTVAIAVSWLFILPTPVLAQAWDNLFSCEWAGIACVVKTPFFPFGCAPGFDADRAVCESIDNFGDCQDQINNACVEISPDQCYECVSVTDGCYPRDCDDPRAEYTDYDSCYAACTGAEPTRFRCEDGQCIEDESGPYEGLQSCLSDCAPLPFSGCIDTGLGCIPTKPEDLILRILEIAIGTAGGIALLSVIFGGFKVLTSSGNPDAISEGKGMITSAIAGLALILFSVTILNIIGFNVLGIPFFNLP